MHIVVVGHAARDVILRRDAPPSSPVLGGAVSYIGLAAAALGATVDIVTVAPEHEALLAPLDSDARITVTRSSAAPLTSFALDYTGKNRVVRLTHRAPTIDDVPERLRSASVAILAPVAAELPPASLGWFPNAQLTVGLQGFMRSARADGSLVAVEPPSMRGANAVCLSDGDHPQAEMIARKLAAEVPIVVLTRGARGASLFHDGHEHHVPSVPADEVNPTGAADVFLAALAVHLARNASPMDAAREASYAAARSVEGPGLGNLRS